MTLDETADLISVDLPGWQRDQNLLFLRGVHRTLRDGGVWASPLLGMVFHKTAQGFELRLDSQ